ncbi:MAG: hypothetical protein IKY45_00195 [Clostridia bacterium]|nr:hypothetical protein [Clostridia bacterium]
MAYGNYAPFYRGGFFNPMQTPTMPNMAENQNQFAQPYQPPMPTQPMTTSSPNNDMIFVLGQNEAESFPVAPNATVTMWDKNQKTFYVKTANAQGIPSMQIYDFVERAQNAPESHAEHACKCGGKFATIEQFDGLQAKINEIQGIVEELQAKPNTKSTKTPKKAEDE